MIATINFILLIFGISIPYPLLSQHWKSYKLELKTDLNKLSVVKLIPIESSLTVEFYRDPIKKETKKQTNIKSKRHCNVIEFL